MSAKSRGFPGKVDYTSAWTAWVCGCMGCVGQIFTWVTLVTWVKILFKWVLTFTWVMWVKIFLSGSIFFRGSKFSAWLKIFCRGRRGGGGLGVGLKNISIGTFTPSFTWILTSIFRIHFSSTLCSSRRTTSKSKLQ